MTALAKDRKSDQLSTPEEVIPPLLNFPVEAATTIYAGGMVATNAAGNAVPASASNAQKLWGRAERTVINTSAAGFGAAGALSIEVKPGVFFFNNGTGSDAIAAGDVGALCYVSDDNTVTKTDAGGTRPLAGVIFPAGTTNNLRSTGEIAVFVGQGSAYVPNPETTPSITASFRARAVYASALATYVAAAGVLTASANGAIANPDGVTVAAGDTIILPPGVAAAVNDSGPYVITTLGTAGTKFVLTRPDWWPTAATLKTGLSIRVGGEGTVYKNTVWQAMTAADSFVVDAADPKFYPQQFSGQSVLVAGTFTISGPVFSAKTNVDLARVVANTSTATTGGYNPTVAGATGITAGAIGTGSIVVQACVAAGTINSADVSTLNWTVTNQA